MADRYPGYDVLAKRHTPSWNAATRRVIDQRLAIPRDPRFFTADEFITVQSLVDRLVPQPAHRAPIPVAALVDNKLHTGAEDGYRPAGMPRAGEAWRLGLRALNAEALRAHATPFHHLHADEKDYMLRQMQQGTLHAPAWGAMQSKDFFEHRMARDIVFAYYAHPVAWNEIGWGGPASPRGYVRMGYDERDPWEAAEAGGNPNAARHKNKHVG